MRQNIIHYLRAGYPGLYLVSPEEQRMEAELKAIAKEIGFHLYCWSATTGIVDTEKGRVQEAVEPVEALLAAQELPTESILLLRDFHVFLDDPNPVLLRQFKDLLHVGKTKSKSLIILGCRLCLPPELERELTVVDFALPGKAQLTVVLDGILKSAELKSLADAECDAALDAAMGLTTIEAENAFALSVVEAKAIVPAIIAREKAQAVKKSGLLEIIDATESLDDVGGLEMLKAWLLKRKYAFGQRAKEYGLPVPKGLLILGIPGTGKSLTAKAIARAFGIPLLRLDAGRLFGSLVGQSEGNLRSAIQTTEAIAPCVLWLDEIEKAFSGVKSSGGTDGGTSARVFGSFIAWMQEKQAPVFIVATANDVSQLPPELLRKGRFDEIFFVDLPTQTEREAIWKIQIRKYRRNPNDFDCIQLARATEGLTGSEIEAVFAEALYQAFDAGSEPTDLTVAEMLTEFVPLSRLMGEQISGLRQWAKGRARRATNLIVAASERRITM